MSPMALPRGSWPLKLAGFLLCGWLADAIISRTGIPGVDSLMLIAGFPMALTLLAVAGVAALGFVAWGPGWRLRQRREREVQVDYWKAMDEGDDPTDEQGSHPGDKSG